MECSECDVRAETEEQLRVHISVRHLRYIPFECRHCADVFLPTVAALRRHAQQMHTAELPVITSIYSHDEQKETELEELLTKSRALGQTGTDNQTTNTDGVITDTTLPQNENDEGAVMKAETDDNIRATPKIEPVAGRPKATCRLCQKQLGTSQSQHIWSAHVLQKRFQCTTCGYASAHRNRLRAHMQTKHPADGDDGFVDRTEQLMEEYDRLKRLAFGAEHRISASEPKAPQDRRTPSLKRRRLEGITASLTLTTVAKRRGQPPLSRTCALCGRTALKKTEAKDAHIWSEHMSTRRLHCRHCAITFNRLNHMQLHLLRAHDDTNGSGYDDMKAHMWQQFLSRRKEAFPKVDETEVDGQNLLVADDTLRDNI